MKIVDFSAGNRAVWFNKNHPDCLFLDKRESVNPDMVVDTTKLPLDFDTDFDLVVFDPPHINFGKNSNMARVYGHHTTKEILELVEGSGREAFRITKPSGLMAFKWNDHDIKLDRILKLMQQWEPLFGALTKDGPGSKTYWVMLKKRNLNNGED